MIIARGESRKCFFFVCLFFLTLATMRFTPEITKIQILYARLGQLLQCRARTVHCCPKLKGT
uniref:Uncharacterized protein n=1 Tax=Anguilla anguilla TaxID=7936 RepID=A0A0E9WZT7_ANGAN